jgi:transposase
MELQGWVVGVDVSKAHLDVAVLPDGAVFQVANDAAGWEALIARLQGQAVQAIGLEPSGGYERGLVRALRRAGLPVRVVNPHRVRLYARARGRLAKTDRIDAAVIARFVAELKPRPPRCDPVAERMAELLTARRQLTDDRVRLANQAEQTQDPWLKRLLARRLRQLQAQILLIGRRLAEIVAADPQKADQARLIQSLPGAGETLSHTLIGLVPEIADASRRELAALVGVAPFDDSSGQRTGKHRICGGRAEVRRVLYMAALAAARCNPTLKAYRDRLVASGVPPKAAIIAVARRMLGILAAMLRKRETYKSTLA